jgi:membrane protein required for colicin V production
MAWVDWAIMIVMALSAMGGLSKGFFRAFCSFGGLFLGLVLAAWNYAFVAAALLPFIHIEPVANTCAFLLIALLVTVAANMVGETMTRTLQWMGLGCLNRIAGGAFGLLQGALLVMLCILVTVAFFPQARWLTEARLPHLFFGACHLSTHMGPAELAERVRDGLRTLELESPRWMHPGTGGL